jgi:RNA polymerase sigma-70 factor (ECF subfamily)
MAAEMLGPDATAALVGRAKRGERDAFAGLVREYLRAAYAVAFAVVGRPADAEDVAQDAFLAAFAKLDTCREPARFSSWLLQIVRNRARNWLDSLRLRDVPAVETEPPPDPAAPATSEPGARERLVAALSLLPPAQREVVLLHDLEDWTHAEIAATLEISEVMSRQHLFQARRTLRERLAADAPREDQP